ncbi:MAG TPA: translation initiation factor IF-2 N-terminal domain-containing protein, partial [Spirochaetota bacterium]|nr:translation initiation factor IF-2 N-terminal domain-containing protein [Spirochaetota bacterium]
MAENDKPELIKKTENKQETQPNKKIVVVKKVKKVIIKKHAHQKQEDDVVNEVKKDIPVVESKIETPNEQTPPKKEGIRIVLSKDKEHRDNRAKTFPNSQGTNRPSFNRQPGIRPSFNNRTTTGASKPFNKSGAGAKGGATTTPVITTDKDRSRKKLNKKSYDNKNYFNKEEEEIQKAFNKRKKEKSQIDSVPDKIDIIDVISISDLAKKMNLKANMIIQKLMELGSMVTINDKIDAETASIVASEYGCKVNVVSLYDQTVIEEDVVENIDLISRPPIVTIMGHVDHGKTKLLDAIRSTDVVAGESGGITQHIGAYSVHLSNGHLITFIDTPGHEAFTMMRARGAQVTDIVILVVAADDGVMPQTVEAIKHAKEAGVAIMVAINKVDKPGANVDRVKQQLTEYDLLPEEWGGQTLYCEVSTLKKLGIKELLESVMLQAEMLDLNVSFKMKAVGFILESKIDQGRGVVATVLISKGTLKVGD